MRSASLTFALLLASVAHADSWAAFEDYDVKSPRGSSTLRLREADDDAITFVLTTGKTSVRGKLSWIPSEVEVLEDGQGAVLFETWACGSGHGTTFARLNAKGEIAWKLGVKDLKLGEEWARYPRSDASIDYCLFWTVDGSRVFLVTTLGSIRFIDLKDGAVSVLPAKDALAHVRKWAKRVAADRSRRPEERLAGLHLSRIDGLDRKRIRMWQLTRPNPWRTKWEPSLLRKILREDADAVVRAALMDPSLRALAISIASYMNDDGVAPVLDALAESKTAWSEIPAMQPEFPLRLCEALPARLPELSADARARTLAWLKAVLDRHPRPKAIAAFERATR